MSNERSETMVVPNSPTESIGLFSPVEVTAKDLAVVTEVPVRSSENVSVAGDDQELRRPGPATVDPPATETATPLTEALAEDAESPDISVHDPETDTEKGEDGIDLPEPESEREIWRKRLSAREPILDYREVDFEHFKNRYGEDDGRHVIEVLKGTNSSLEEVWLERRRRRESAPLNPGGASQDAGETSWWQRIRINSWPILGHLKQVAGVEANWPQDTPRTFFRPFHSLIFYQEKMREALKTLEDKWGEVDKLDAAGDKEKAAELEATIRKAARAARKKAEQDEHDNAVAKGEKEDTRTERSGSVNGDEKKDDDAESDDGSSGDRILDSVTALRHMRCFVDVIDRKVLPLKDMFKDTSRTKVRFNDLTLLLQPGVIAYAPPSQARSYQTAWRVYHVKRTTWHSGQPDDIEQTSSDTVKVCCFYIDYDGVSYGVVKGKFQIQQYVGEKAVLDLPLYPMHYAEDRERIQHNLRAQGDLFQTFVKEKHLYYEGWTIPSGNPDTDEDAVHPEHIESAAILDFAEAFKHHPSWKPKLVPIGSRMDDWESGEDSFDLMHWSDRSRDELWFWINEKTQSKENIHFLMKNQYLSEVDKFVIAYRQGPVKELEGEEYSMLLPRRLVAYVLRERRFVQVDALSLRHLPKQDRLLKDLKINPGHKRMIRSLVKAHFRNREIQRERPLIGLNQDLIQGKGAGLFILLHGAPGVGKTATAEAIAQSNNKPLFPITCGDLGFTPKEVESELKEIFRLAHLWDCVLLLDEADIFLARRDMVNLKRNALVSVFLRVLEYYSGILFLTTNRVGILDEAFKSRIHVSLYYERLDLDRTLAIFDVNIRKLRAIEKEKAKQLKDSTFKEPPLRIESQKIRDFAERHFEETPDPARWNGRQIRNAFQIASSLARYDMRKTKADASDNDVESKAGGKLKGGEALDPEPVLDEKHFELVADAIERFDTYFHLATGTNDEDAARTEGYRDDAARHEDLVSHHPHHRQSYSDMRTPPSKLRGSNSTKGTDSAKNGKSSGRGQDRDFDDDNGGRRGASSKKGATGRGGGKDTSSVSSRQTNNRDFPAAASNSRRGGRNKYQSEEEEEEEEEEEVNSDEESPAATPKGRKEEKQGGGKSSRNARRRDDDDDDDDDDHDEDDD
ncbi:hypothetical protein B0T19DRAFT_439608 [Cercophora scortea]|uniref:AAA+ ATPase domain-containing protein n=1 Tax=Cercophora scortea TaxID=314031 RepID=A0AAE0IYC8_9PEZI|nr:hypothetical protein B0T19DRAFT_439608 [Cercophora scortea]